MVPRSLVTTSILLWAASSGATVHGARRQPLKARSMTEVVRARQPECTEFQLGQLLVQDTSKMSRRSYRGPIEESTGGVDATAYYQGSVLRIVRARYAGEMGFTTVTFYLRDGGTRDFVVDYANSRYAAPVGMAGDDRIVSMSRQFFYVCGGNAQSFFTDRAEKLPDWLSELRAVLPGPG